MKRLAAALLGVMIAGAAAAQEPAGRVVELQGRVDLVRGETKTAADVNTPLEIGDRLVWAPESTVRLLFRDGSTVLLGGASELVIDHNVFDPDQGSVESVLKLLQGKLRAIVSEYYGQPDRSYVIRTPASVSGVREPDFVVRYDARERVSEVVDLEGSVTVDGIGAAEGHEVTVTAGQITRVPVQEPPSAPVPLAADDRGRLLDDLHLSGIAALQNALADAPGASDTAQASGHGSQPPAGLGQDPGGRVSTPGDAAGQPVGAIQGAGGISVPF